MTLSHYLILSAILFAIGVYGALTRRNAIGILLCIEIMLNAVNINLVSFSKYITPQELTGQIFTIFTITIAAAEAAVGLAIIIAIYRHIKTVNVEKINLMKW
ncbi:MAG: NADH-quinone oxidoreductase subunit NuoK [bacterium]